MLTALFLLQANNAASELPIHIQCFFASNGVPADERMYVDHGIASNNSAAVSCTRKLSLFKPGVCCLESPEEVDKGGRELLEDSDLRSLCPKEKTKYHFRVSWQQYYSRRQCHHPIWVGKEGTVMLGPEADVRRKHRSAKQKIELYRSAQS